MFQRSVRKSRGHNVGLLGSAPRHGNTQGQMGQGMKRMLAGTSRMGLLGNAPMANTDNSMYQQQQRYDQTEDFNEYEMEDNSMYNVDQRGRQGMYNANQQRQGLIQTGNARQAMSRIGRVTRNVQPEEEYYEEEADNQNYISDSWGTGEEETGWDYGQEQHARGGALLETPRHVRQSPAGVRMTAKGQPGRGRGLLGQGNVMQRNSLLGQPIHGQGRGLLGPASLARTQIMQRNQPLLVDRQTELLQKADLQIRMLQQEQQKTERMQELQQQEEERRRAREMQNLLETQQRALMLQQKESQMRRGDGLLGDHPLPGGQVGIIQQRGNIPSLLDVGQPVKSLLGKRPSAAMARAAQASKRARQESQINRNRPVIKSRRPSPKRGQRSSPRRSRFDSRDRKESESHKSSGSRVTSSSSSREHNRSKRHESKDVKPKKEVTEVTVKTEEVYDPSEPTGDVEEVKDESFKMVKSEAYEQMMEVDDPPKADLKPKAEGWEKKEEKETPSETNLTVTVSKKGRSVNDSDSKKTSPEKEKKYKCNVCGVKCYDEESFSRHMNGVKHKKKMDILTTTTTQSSSLIAARKQAEEHLRQIEAKRSSGPNKAQPPGKALESHCKVCNEMFTGAYKDHKAAPKHKAREDRSKAGCKVCKVTSFNTYRDFIKHLESDWHLKKQKQASWPECKICNQKFKSPRKFVLHCKTDHHIENKKKRGDQDEDLDDLGDLVTLDTVGFEEETQNDTTNKEKEDIQNDTTNKEKEDIPQPKEPLTSSTPKISVSSTKLKVEEVTKEPLTTSTPKVSVSSTKLKVEEMTTPVKQTIEEEDILREYDPNVAVGQRFVMPVSGFFCKLCHKFYNNESAAKGSHCQSQSHFEKYQKVVLAKMMSRSLSKEVTSKNIAKQEKQTTQSEGHTSANRNDVKQEMEITVTKPLEDQKRLNQSEKPAKSTENQSATIVECRNQSTNGQEGNELNQDAPNYETADEQSQNSLYSTEAMDTSEHEGEDEIRIEILAGKKDISPRVGGPKAKRGRRPKKRV